MADDAFEIWAPARLARLPSELHVEVRRFPRRRVEAYWDGWPGSSSPRSAMHDIAEFLKEHEPFSGARGRRARAAGRARGGGVLHRPGRRSSNRGRAPGPVRVIRRGAVELVDHGRVLDLLGEGELFGHPSMVSRPADGVRGPRARGLALLLARRRGRASAPDPSRGLRYLARSLLARPKPGPVVAADVSGFDLAQQPVRALIRGSRSSANPTSLRDAAERMANRRELGAGSGSTIDELGIVTDQDLRSPGRRRGPSVDTP